MITVIIIQPHLDHMLKSYYHTTGYSVFAYNHLGHKIGEATDKISTDLYRLMDRVVVQLLSTDLNISTNTNDSILLEVDIDLYTLIAPVYGENKPTLYIMTLPFIIDYSSSQERKSSFDINKDHFNLPITYQMYMSFPVIKRNRLNYLGQLFYHLMANSIYVGMQHFIPKEKMKGTRWGQTLPLDSFQYTEGFINMQELYSCFNIIFLHIIRN